MLSRVRKRPVHTATRPTGASIANSKYTTAEEVRGTVKGGGVLAREREDALRPLYLRDAFAFAARETGGEEAHGQTMVDTSTSPITYDSDRSSGSGSGSGKETQRAKGAKRKNPKGKVKRTTVGRYSKVHSDALRQHQVGFSDMTLLWWWVVSLTDHVKDTGVPWRFFAALGPQELREAHAASVNRVKFILRHDKMSIRNASLALTPPHGLPLRVCNGLDVRNRTVLDHMLGWCSDRRGFSLNIAKGGLPFTKGPATMYGGQPESTDSQDIKNRLHSANLYFETLHYQGLSKEYIRPDLCRVLLRSPRYATHQQVQQKQGQRAPPVDALTRAAQNLCKGVHLDECYEHECLVLSRIACF
jgi:hypothetical protein